MWVVSWLGRQDPDPRTRLLSTRCATFSSAREMARRIATAGGLRVVVKRMDGDAGGVVEGPRRIRRVVDENGMCVHELKADWCFYCREAVRS